MRGGMLTSLVATLMTSCNAINMLIPHTTNCTKQHNLHQLSAKCLQVTIRTIHWKDLQQFCCLPDARRALKIFDLPDHRKDNIETGLARIFMIYCCDCNTLFLAYCFFCFVCQIVCSTDCTRADFP